MFSPSTYPSPRAIPALLVPIATGRWRAITFALPASNALGISTIGPSRWRAANSSAVMPESVTAGARLVWRFSDGSATQRRRLARGELAVVREALQGLFGTAWGV